MPPPATETPRDALTARVLPQMVLSKGDENSKTPAPRPVPASLSAEGRAKLRFEVQGNAM
jgi:sorbose reductase